MMRNTAVLRLTLCIFSSLGAARLAHADILDLGHLGERGSSAMLLNDAGVVAGMSLDAGGVSHTFVYDGAMHDIGTLGAGTNYFPTALNPGGLLVGYALYPGLSGQPPKPRAFLYDGVLRDLGTLPGGTVSWAVAINASGVVVGYADGPPSPVSLGFRVVTWGPAGIPSVLGNFYGKPVAINDAGVICGNMKDAPSSHDVAFRYDGALHRLGTLGGATSEALGINAAGMVYGQSSTSPSTSNSTAFLHDGTTMHELSFGGLRITFAVGMSASGKVAGTAYFPDEDYSRAFLYDGAMHDLGTFGGRSSAATAINDAGVVVGWAESAAGEKHAFQYDGAMHELPALRGRFSIASGINAAGAVYGVAQKCGSGDTHAFYYDGTLQEIGTLGGRGSVVVSMNASGSMVGYSETAANLNRAFLFTPPGTPVQPCDSDHDGVLEADDHCPGTVLAAPDPLTRPGYLDDSGLILGCNRSQVLACKPGNNAGERTYGLTPGSQDIFASKTSANPKGWAEACRTMYPNP